MTVDAVGRIVRSSGVRMPACLAEVVDLLQAGAKKTGSKFPSDPSHSVVHKSGFFCALVFRGTEQTTFIYYSPTLPAPASLYPSVPSA